MKNYRFYRDINAENEDEVIAWMDERAEEAITEYGTLVDMFQIQENPFTAKEQKTIIKAARLLLNDAEQFDAICVTENMTDTELKNLQEKVNNSLTSSTN